MQPQSTTHSPFERLWNAQDELADLSEVMSQIAFNANHGGFAALAIRLKDITCDLHAAIEAFCEPAQ